MIDALDHVTLRVRDIHGAAADYAALLGRGADPEARFQTGNMALHLAAAAADELGAVAFAVGDLDKAVHRLGRRALATEPVVDDGRKCAAISTKATHGIPLALIERKAAAAPAAAEPGSVIGLDHVVIGTPDAERAVALYGGRLGLDLRLDRSNPDWGTRLLFFRCGDLVVEIAQRLGQATTEGPDTFRGFSWRVAGIDAHHARLAASGFDVSEIRTGRRPGTRVFTVRNRTAGVPTLFLGA